MLGIAGLIYGFLGIPWANMYGGRMAAVLFSVVFYGALLVAAMYCRCNTEPIHSKLFHRKVRRTPQSL